MDAAETVVAIIVFVLAGICGVISAFQFAEKGFLFHNVYLWASEQQRKQMDKKPYYRQSAIVFCLLCAVFLIPGSSVVLQNAKLCLLEIPLMIGVLSYVVVSSIRIEKRTKR